MGHRRKKAGPMQIIIPTIVIIALACLALSVIILKELKENSTQEVSVVEAPDYDNADKWSEGIVTYNNQEQSICLPTAYAVHGFMYGLISVNTHE